MNVRNIMTRVPRSAGLVIRPAKIASPGAGELHPGVTESGALAEGMQRIWCEHRAVGRNIIAANIKTY
jgi:hypothetical protein